MDILEKQLCSIHAAYVVGRAKPVVWISDNDFQQNLKQEWNTPLLAHDEAFLTKCARFREAALKAAREGKLPVADYLFAETEKLLNMQGISPVAVLMVQSAHESAVAYLDYRRADFTLGTARIYRALAIDETLENTYGYTYYHIHRLRLLLNLVHLKRRQGERAEALKMSVILADYLEQKISVLPFPTSWDVRRLESLPFASKNFLFEQAMMEIAFLLVGQPELPAESLYDFQQHICADASAPCLLSPRSHCWLQSKQALLTKDTNHYLEIISPLIAEGPDSAIWLWYAILFDLVLFCLQLPQVEAHNLAQAITTDMSSWHWSRLPPAWKQLIEKLPVYSHI